MRAIFSFEVLTDKCLCISYDQLIKDLVIGLCQSNEKIEISTVDIPLGKFLKLTNVFASGGMIKRYLQDNGVFVNEKLEKRRGRKLLDGDIVKINEIGTYIVVQEDP